MFERLGGAWAHMSRSEALKNRPDNALKNHFNTTLAKTPRGKIALAHWSSKTGRKGRKGVAEGASPTTSIQGDLVEENL